MNFYALFPTLISIIILCIILADEYEYEEEEIQEVVSDKMNYIIDNIYFTMLNIFTWNQPYLHHI